MLADQIIKNSLEKASLGEAMGKAISTYYRERPEMLKELSNNPGYGMIVLFTFEIIPPPAAAPDTMPAQYRFDDMRFQLAVNRDERVDIVAKWKEASNIRFVCGFLHLL